MYSILFSKIELAGDMMVPKLKEIISKDSKVAIFSMDISERIKWGTIRK